MSRKRIQQRGICPVCLNEQAVQGGRIVPHGYKVHEGSQVGDCGGTNAPHLGSVHCPDFLKNNIDKLNKEIEKLQRKLTAYNAAKDAMKSTLDAWKESATRQVDLDVEEQEQVALRKQKAKLLQEEKLIKKELSEEKRKAREEKIKANKADFLNTLKGDKYANIYYKGNLIASWCEHFNSEDDFYTKCHDKRLDHHRSLGNDDNIDAYYASFYLYELRDQANGKGKRLLNLSCFDSARKYFNAHK